MISIKLIISVFELAHFLKSSKRASKSKSAAKSQSKKNNSSRNDSNRSQIDRLNYLGFVVVFILKHKRKCRTILVLMSGRLKVRV